jgi:hypothetical protein
LRLLLPLLLLLLICLLLFLLAIIPAKDGSEQVQGPV